MPCAVSQGEIDWYKNQSKIKEEAKVSGGFTEILCQACVHLFCETMADIKERDFGTLLNWYCGHLCDDLKIEHSAERKEQIMSELHRINDYRERQTCTT